AGPSCRINRVAAERDIRLKVGRYRLRTRHDERHPFHRVRSGRPVQDRIIAKACANASDSRGRSDAVEKTLYLHQARGLGFCKQALSGPKAVLGTGDLAQIHTSRGTTSRNSEAIRMAYVPALSTLPDYVECCRTTIGLGAEIRLAARIH